MRTDMLSFREFSVYYVCKFIKLQEFLFCKLGFYPSRTCASRGLCDWGWCPFMYVNPPPPPQKKLKWHFSSQLTFSNTRCRLLVKFILQKHYLRRANQGLPYLMHTFLYLSEGWHKLRSQNPIGKYRHLVNWPWNPREHTTVAIGRPDNMQNRCRTGGKCECEEHRLRRVLPLVANTTMSKRNTDKSLHLTNSKLLLYSYISNW